MGIYVYMARKSKPLTVEFEGEKIKAYRYVYVSRLSAYNADYASVNRVVGRIASAWGGEKPKYGIEAEDLKETAFTFIRGGLKSITWSDCSELGKIVGCAYRNIKNRWESISIEKFEAIIERIGGCGTWKLLDKKELVLDTATKEGHLIATFIRAYASSRQVKIISPAEVEERASFVI